MISDFHLKGYRGFQDFELENFSRVNVLVGKNNAGKSSLLEAMYLNATSMDMSVIQNIALRRGEVAYDGRSRDLSNVELVHFFNGHKIREGKQIEIGTRSNYFRLTVAENPESSVQQLFAIDAEGNDRIRDSRFLLKTTYFRGDSSRNLQDSYLAADGTIQALRRSVFGGGASQNFRNLFIYPDSLDNALLSNLWNKVIVKNEESAIVDALRILEPRVASIAFLLSEQSPARFIPRSIAGIVIGMEGGTKRLPLGSLGDGMKRLLAIALALATTRDGALFIDEIDSGFHYSVMKKLWKLIIRTATKNKVQVFASTHSLDCLRGLQVVEEDDLSDGVNGVSLYTINPEFPKATYYSAKEIPGIIKNEIEVR